MNITRLLLLDVSVLRLAFILCSDGDILVSGVLWSESVCDQI